MNFKNNKKTIIGIAVIVILAVVGTVGALNGWFGGGATIPDDTFTRGLVGYWNMDESNGSLAKDSSPYSNDGMINDGGSGNPVSYWTFDEQTGTTAYDSIGSNNGTLTSGPAWTSSGKVGGGISFDGVNDYVTTNEFAISGTDRTFELWMKTPGTITYESIFEQNVTVSSTSSPYVNGFNGMNGNPNQIHLSVGDGAGNHYDALQTSIASYLNQWIHLVGVIKGGNELRIYINGVSVADKATTVSPETASRYVFMGRMGTKYFNGIIDDARIYNYARTADEIQRDYIESYKSKWVPGKVAGAMQFNGVDDFVDVGNGTSLNAPTEITIEAWVKFNNITAGQQIVSKRAAWDTPSGYSLIFDYSTVNGIEVRGRQFNYARASDAGLATNVWYHIVGTLSDDWSKNKVYINGTNRTISTSNGETLEDNTDNVYIGSRPGINSFFNGLIDEVRIYNRALSAAEVKFHYSRGGPVGYWKFDEGTGTLAGDISGNMNNAVIHGPSLNFDGNDDYVDCGDNTSLNITSTLTLMAWIKPESRTTYQGIISKDVADGVANLIYMIYIDDSGNLRGYISNGSSSQATPYKSLAAGDLNQYMHVAFVLSSTYLRLYVNGAEVESGTARTINPQSIPSANLFIGSYGGGTINFDGTIDEPRVYNRALSATEVNESYRGLFKNETGLIGYWPFDENTGDTAYDRSGNSNNGDLAGSGTVCGTGGACPTWVSREGPTWTTGKSGNALSFDGTDDYVDAGTGLASKIYPLTFEAWVKPNTLSQNGIILNFDVANANSDYAFGIYNTGNKIFVGRSTYLYGLSGISTYLTAGQWQHWVVVFTDTTHITFYLDGVQKTLSIVADYYSADGSKTTIGSRQGAVPDKFFNGTIDDVRIYNYVRTADEIRLDYNAGFAAKFGPNNASCDKDPGSCITKDLVGYWSLDEGTGTTATDGSGNSNTGTLTNNPTWTQGKKNGALRFDGVNDYVDCGNNATLNPTSATTIEAWVKPNSVTAGSYKAILSNWGASVPNGYLFYGQYSLNGTWFHFEMKIGDVGKQFNVASVFTANTWVHLVLVYDGSYLRTYKNGVAIGTPTAATGTINAFTSNLKIGAYSQSPISGYFNGSVDEVKIYSRALSAEEIRYQYNRSGPIAQWKFNEGSGTTAYDSTDNNNDGTLTGDPTWIDGKYGSALSFDGTNDYVNMGDVSILNFERTNPFSISGWFKHTVTGVNQIILSKQQGTSPARGWRVMLGTDDKLSLYLYNNPDTSNFIGATTVSAFTDANTWVQFTTTYDGSNTNAGINIYINGVLTSVTPSLATLTDTIQTSVSVNIGARDNGYLYFNGSIDDVRIYNYVRTADEIRLDYNAGLAAKFGPNNASCDKDPGSCVTQGLVGYWSLDEGTGTTAVDGSGNSNTGTLTGPQWTKGKVGNALSFDGINDYADCGNLGAFPTTGAIVFWMKPSQILSYRNPLSTHFPGEGGIRFEMTTAGKFVAYKGEEHVYTASLQADTWYHVALVWNVTGNNVIGYLNGTSVFNEAHTSWGILLDSVQIGRGYDTTANRHFKGIIDEVRIYNRALTVEEIRYQYNRGGPVAQWKFNEGEGITAYDSTDNNNDGTLTSGPTWAEGKYGSALSFDGVDDSISVPTTASMKGQSQFTLSTWFYVDSFRASDQSIYQEVTGVDTNSRILIRIIETTNVIQFGGRSTDTDAYTVWVTTPAISAGAWYHIAAVFDSVTDVHYFYINGVATSGSVTATTLSNTTPTGIIRIGADSSGRYFDGLIDDVRIYNYARTAEQILQDYNSGSSVYFK